MATYLCKRIIILCAGMLLSFTLFGGNPGMDQIKRVAVNFIFEKNGIEAADYARLSNDELIDQLVGFESDSLTLFYLLSFRSTMGFVLVSNEDRTIPVLGYSLEANYVPDNVSLAFQGLINFYKEQIIRLKTSDSNCTRPLGENLWLRYGQEKDRFLETIRTPSNSTLGVPALLSAKWNQGEGWNQFCPPDPEAPGGRALVGCVAVAMAQIMDYWNHPYSGSGSNFYYHPVYGGLHANFGDATYDWNLMSDTEPDTYNSLLLNHCGVSVNMNYGPFSSSAYTHEVLYSLREYFGYKSGARFESRVSYSSADWTNLLKAELDNQRPVIYQGFDSTTGHAFVLDGYDDSNYFHVNWGWGGQCDGYFTLDNLNPCDYYSFNNAQAAGIMIEPQTECIPVEGPPSLQLVPAQICAGQSSSLNVVGGDLVPESEWYTYRDYCNGVLIGKGSYFEVAPDVSTAYFSIAKGRCFRWGDSFESYPESSFPSLAWQADGNATNGTQNYIDRNTYYQGVKSLRLFGQPGGCNPAIARRALIESAPYEIEVLVRNGAESLSGCRRDRAVIGLRKGNSATNPYRELLRFGGDGRIYAGGSSQLNAFDPETWYRIRIRYEILSAEQLVKLSVKIDNEDQGEWTFSMLQQENQFDHLELSVAEGAAWFDALKVNKTTYSTGVCASATLTVKPVVSPQISISPSSAEPVCEGGTVSFTATALNGGSSPSFQWYLNGNTSGTNSPNYNTPPLPANALVHCRLTSSESCADRGVVNSDTVAIHVNSLPAQPGQISGAADICAGTTQTYSVPAIEGVGYTWTAANGTISGSGHSMSVNWGVPGNQILRIVPSNGCGNGPARELNVSVVVVPAQPGTIDGSTTACGGVASTYAVDAASGVNYLWTVTNGLISGSGNSVSITFSSAGNQSISVTPSNSCGSGTARQMTVAVSTVPGQPEAISGETSLCKGASANYNVAAASGVQYAWSASGGTVSGNGNQVQVTWDEAGSRQLTVTPSNGCGTGTIRELPVVVLNVPSQPGNLTGKNAACASTAEMYSVPAVAGVSYSWTATQGTVSGSGNTAQILWNSSGKQTVAVTPTNFCGKGPERRLDVDVGTIPALPDPIAGNTVACLAVAEEYRVTAVSGVTYTWNSSSGTATGSGNISLITFGASSIQHVSVTPANNCGNGPARQLNVTVNAPPAQPEAISGEISLCKGASANYNVAAVSGVQYAWSASGGTVSGNGNQVQVTWNEAGSRQLTVTPSNGCGNGVVRELPITVLTVPSQPGIITGKSAACADAAELYSIPAISGISYHWTAQNGVVTESGNSVNITWNLMGAQSLTVVPSNICGTGPERLKEIVVGAVPDRPEAFSGNTTVCIGVTELYSVMQVTGVNYAWEATGGTVSANGSAARIIWSASGEQKLTVTPSNTCGNGIGSHLTVSVSAPPPQPGTIAGDNTACLGGTVTYHVPHLNGVQYNWAASGGTVIGSGHQVKITWNSTGNRALSVVPSNSCGNGTAQKLTVSVVTMPPQPAAIDGSGTTCTGKAQAYSIAAAAGTDYYWTATGGTASGSGHSVQVTWSAAGAQQLTVVPSNTCGIGPEQKKQVEVGTVPAQPGPVSGLAIVCSGALESYSVEALPGVDYTWSVSGGSTNGSGNSAEIAWSTSGNQQLTVTPGNTCGNGPVRQLSVTVRQIPDRPGVISGDTSPVIGKPYSYRISPVQGAEHYAWHVSAGEFSGSGHGITVVWNALYAQTIAVRSGNGCGESGESLLQVEVLEMPTAIPVAEYNPVRISPNPAKNRVYVQHAEWASGMVMYSASGQIVREAIGLDEQFEIDLHGLKSGAYVLKIFSDKKLLMKTILIKP